MLERSSEETSDSIDNFNPYQSPETPLTPESRGALTRAFRWSFIGAGVGGCVGAMLMLGAWAMILLFEPVEGADDEVGPMFLAMIPFLAIGFVVLCAAVGQFLGGVLGGFTSMLDRTSTRSRLDRSV